MDSICQISLHFSSVLFWIITAVIFLVFAFSGFILRLKIKSLKKDITFLRLKIDEDAALIDKKEKLFKEQNKIIEERKKEDDIRRWSADGHTKFSDILRHVSNNLENLVQTILSELIKYLHVEIGGFWLKKFDEEGKTIYELKVSVAFDKKNLEKKIIYEKEELVGACAADKKTLYLNNITENYIQVTSGLGGSKPKDLLLVPMVYNEEVQGVLEIASLNSIDNYKIKFIEEVAEKIAGTIINVLANEKTGKLLEESEKQAAELIASEEELRQNLEEVQATQELAAQREEELIKKIKGLQDKIKELEEK